MILPPNSLHSLQHIADDTFWEHLTSSMTVQEIPAGHKAADEHENDDKQTEAKRFSKQLRELLKNYQDYLPGTKVKHSLGVYSSGEYADL